MLLQLIRKHRLSDKERGWETRATWALANKPSKSTIFFYLAKHTPSKFNCIKFYLLTAV